MIDFDRKLAFVHLPKTGGTSLIAALLHPDVAPEGPRRLTSLDAAIPTLGLGRHFPGGRPHCTAAELVGHLRSLGEDPDRYTLFAVFRNPWARAASFYNWWLRQRGNPTEGPDFREFMLQGPGQLIARTTGFRMIGLAHFERTELLRQERLDDDFGDLLARRGLAPIALPRVNRSDGRDHHALFADDEELIDHVRRESFLEVVSMGYRYDDPGAV